MATIPGTQLAGVFRFTTPENFSRSRVAPWVTGTGDAVFLIHGTFIPSIPFASHERTGDDQTNRTINIRDLSDDADAPRDYFLNPLPK
jgi:hypothetical protein